MDAASLTLSIVAIVIAGASALYIRRQATYTQSQALTAEKALRLAERIEEERREEKAAAEFERLKARPTVRRETRQPQGGGAAIVIVNEGLAAARHLAIEVTGSAMNNSLVLEGGQATAEREELLSKETWAVPLERAAGRDAMPVTGVIRWRDGRGEIDEEKWQVTAVGVSEL